MSRPKVSVSPAWLLFFLAPMIGELLSGSAPPAEFFQPLPLIVLASLYGSGAVIARELTHRWGRSWGALLLLGAAYGILEEGLMVKSFFDPTWMDLGPLGSYGRWGGVNWVWALELTLYHAVFSITIPVLLVTLLFPRRRFEPWVGRRTWRFLWVLLFADVLFGFLALTPYRPPLIPYLLAAVAMVGLTILARRMPVAPRAPGGDRGLPRPVWMLVFGFASTVGLFACSWLLPNTRVPALVCLGLIVGLVLVVRATLLRIGGSAVNESPPHLLHLAAGALGFFILLAPLQELDSTRPDNTAGMALVGLAAIALLLWVGRIARRGFAASEGAPGVLAAGGDRGT